MIEKKQKHLSSVFTWLKIDHRISIVPYDTIGQLNNTKLSSQLLMVILVYFWPGVKRITRLQIYRVDLLVVS